MLIDGRPTSIFLNSGAQVSLISTDRARMLSSLPIKVQQPLKGYNGRELVVATELYADVMVKNYGNECPINFYATDGMDFDVLLSGTDFKKLGLSMCDVPAKKCPEVVTTKNNKSISNYLFRGTLPKDIRLVRVYRWIDNHQFLLIFIVNRFFIIFIDNVFTIPILNDF